MDEHELELDEQPDGEDAAVALIADGDDVLPGDEDLPQTSDPIDGSVA